MYEMTLSDFKITLTVKIHHLITHFIATIVSRVCSLALSIIDTGLVQKELIFVRCSSSIAFK